MSAAEPNSTPAVPHRPSWRRSARIATLFRAKPAAKAKPAPTVAARGAPFAPSVMRQLEAGRLLAVQFGEAVFAVPRERHAAARAVILAFKARKITQSEAVATLTTLARG